MSSPEIRTWIPALGPGLSFFGCGHWPVEQASNIFLGTVVQLDGLVVIRQTELQEMHPSIKCADAA